VLKSRLCLLLITFTCYTNVLAVGLMPVPTLDEVIVDAAVIYDTNSKRYNYRYTITNPLSNTGEIWYFKLDVSQSNKYLGEFDRGGYSFPFGTVTKDFANFYYSMNSKLPPGVDVVPFGQQLPVGWLGGFTRASKTIFATSTGTPRILPGQTRSGFNLTSAGLPSIREIEFIPHWVYEVEDHGTSDSEKRKEADVIGQSLPFHSHVLGPAAGYPLGSYEHWNFVRDEFKKAENLGWITDGVFANNVHNKLAEARTAYDAQDGTLAKTILAGLLVIIGQSDATQRTAQGYLLLTLNAERLIAETFDTPIPFEPNITVSQTVNFLAIGSQHTVTALVVNTANNDEPLQDETITFEVTHGPHKGLYDNIQTNQQGIASFTYTGTKEGTDTISVYSYFGEMPKEGGDVAVTWKGGPDLAIAHFIPPMLISKGGNKVYISDITTNLGSLSAAPSVTRYYVSTTPDLNQQTAKIIGERHLTGLEPAQENSSATQSFTLPTDLPTGNLFLMACADAVQEIVELDETNNCSTSVLANISSNVMAMEPAPNSPPSCNGAQPSISSMWPPNHKFVSIDVTGITDPDGDSITVLIDSIFQDEPTNGLGDGDTSPDGFGVGTTQAQVRAERSGLLNGRVYTIKFTASDPIGATCTQSVIVGVPHDKHSFPVNDGAK